MKRFLLTAAITLSLTGAGFAAPVEREEVSVTESAVIVDSEEDSGQTIIAELAPGEEADYIEESPMARKMTQAEKAHNAAVNDSWGGAITIVAMCIVISALAILSLLFLGFGKISQSFMQKKKRETAKATPEGITEEEHHAVDSGEAIAAIAAALAEHFGEGHDIEDTILTIRRMKRAYSPWNSKIYNLRVMPELHRNPRP
ncbi:MAG: OadG family protein [Muribaculaceae bacterium]|nr:OadG family protein [Muribaculaceae bacterium]